MNNFDAGFSFFLFYFGVVAFSLFYSAFGTMTNKRRKYYLFVVFSVFWFIMAFRSVSMGNDTVTYYNGYQSIAEVANPFAFMKQSSLEDGYILYVWLLSQISSNPQLLFVVTSAIICTSVGQFADKYVGNLGIFCCLFVGMLHFDFLLSAVRQGLAIAFLLWAFSSLYEKRKVRFVLLGITACLFHNSSVIFLVIAMLIMFFKSTKLHNVYFTSMMFIVAYVCGMFLDQVLQFGLTLFPRYAYYLNGQTMNGEPRLAVILKILVAALLLWTPSIGRRTSPVTDRIDRVGYSFSIVNIVILLISIGTPILTRLSAPFSVFVIGHYANQVHRLRGRQGLCLILLTILAFFLYGLVIVVLKTPEWQTTYPINFSWSL